MKGAREWSCHDGPSIGIQSSALPRGRAASRLEHEVLGSGRCRLHTVLTAEHLVELLAPREVGLVELLELGALREQPLDPSGLLNPGVLGLS